MNVTRDIVKDLLPLYVAGEGSPETRAAVESFLESDPELARIADALRADELAAAHAAATPPGENRAALVRTKALLRRRSWLLSFAIFFTGLPLSFAADQNGVRFFFLRDAPALASASLAAGAALWIVYFVTSRRLRVTGL
jgi:anti-sigma factor RsiW